MASIALKWPEPNRGRSIPGLGIGRDGDWPPEPSVLAFGLPRAEAEGPARDLGQNACFWIEIGCAPELMITLDPGPAWSRTVCAGTPWRLNIQPAAFDFSFCVVALRQKH
jgi:hypothetical protein